MILFGSCILNPARVAGFLCNLAFKRENIDLFSCIFTIYKSKHIGYNNHAKSPRGF